MNHRVSLFFGQVGKNVDALLLDELEGDCQMVVLQDAFVVVHDGEVGRSVDEELVRDAGVIDVVNCRREYCADALQVWAEGKVPTIK